MWVFPHPSLSLFALRLPRSLFATSCFLLLLRAPLLQAPFLLPPVSDLFFSVRNKQRFPISAFTLLQIDGHSLLRPFDPFIVLAIPAHYSAEAFRSPPPPLPHKSHIAPKTINMSLAEHSVRQSEKAATNNRNLSPFSLARPARRSAVRHLPNGAEC